MKILVVDDESAIVESIQEILEEQKHEVITASNGLEGLKCLDYATANANTNAHVPNGEGFKLILLDLMMPIMDGERFLEALSERPEATTASVIVMTASQKIPTSVLPLRILRKPIELDYLLKMVEEVR